MKKKCFRKVLAMILTVGMLISMCACGDKSKDYAGTWIGQGGSALILNSDGTCKYTYTKWDEATEGTWSIEDNRIIVKGCLSYHSEDYDIYADIGESSESLLFQSDSSHWNDELFIKSN